MEQSVSPIMHSWVHWRIVLLSLLVLSLGIGAITWYQAPAHPDEHYQIFEPAHARNYPDQFYVTWEWERGMRSWTLPVAISWGNRVLESLGIRSQTKVFVWRVFLFVLHVLALLSLISIFSESKQRWLYGFLVFTSWATYYFGSRFLGDSVSTTAVLPALALLLPGLLRKNTLPASSLVLAGILFGIAFSIRFQTLLLAVGVGLSLIYVYRSLISVMLFLVPYLFMVGLQGVVDWVTWGGFLHSFFGYLQANVLENKAVSFGVTSWDIGLSFYFRFLTAVVAIILIPALVRGFRQNKVLLIVIAPFFLVHVLSLHKELRFFYPLVPLVYMTAVLGWSAYERVPKLSRAGMAFIMLVVFSNVVQFFFFTYHDKDEEQQYRDVFVLSKILPINATLKVAIANDLLPWGYHSYFDRPDVTPIFSDRQNLMEELNREPHSHAYYFIYKDPDAVVTLPKGCQNKGFRVNWLVWCDEGMKLSF